MVEWREEANFAHGENDNNLSLLHGYRFIHCGYTAFYTALFITVSKTITNITLKLLHPYIEQDVLNTLYILLITVIQIQLKLL